MRKPSLNNGFRIAAGLLFCAVLAWLAGGGAMVRSGSLYLDNPAHLAEIMERSAPGWCGWSDLAFCGFPSGLWHSPLLYGTLAWGVRLGLPLHDLYTAAMFLAFLFPALVLFSGGRRRLGPTGALWVSALLLLQPPVLYGIGSVWGGMWTFYLAAGAFLWLMQRWAENRGTWLGDAALIGFIGLAHLFVLALIPVLALVRLIAGWRTRESRRMRMARLLAACVAGVLASAAYWLPALLTRSSVDWFPQHLSPGRLLWALCVPANLQELTSAAPVKWSDAWSFGTIPMLLLILLGVMGGCRSRANGNGVSRRMGLGLALAILIGLLLLPVLPESVNWVWGPVSWRLLYVVRLGLAWSAIEVLSRFDPPKQDGKILTWPVIASGVLILIFAYGLAFPLRRSVQDSGDCGKTEVRTLWNRIQNAYSGIGFSRICLQDTYGVSNLSSPLLRHSHVLALTSTQTGRTQAGAYYGMAPQATAPWTAGEFGLLFGLSPYAADAVPQLLHRLRRADCGLLAVCSPAWRDRLSVVPALKQIHHSDLFSLYRLERSPSDAVRRNQGPGRIDLQLQAPAEEGRIEVSEAWHPFWRLDPPVPGAEIFPSREQDGLFSIEALPSETREIHLRFSAPGWPRLISLLAWAGLAGAALVRRVRRIS